MLGFRKTFAEHVDGGHPRPSSSAYHRPLETRKPGECDRAVRALLPRRRSTLLERPEPQGRRRHAGGRRAGGAQPPSRGRSSRTWHGGLPPTRARRTVFLAGDFYIKAVPVANDFVIRRLNERGLQVIVEPIAVMMEYMAEERLSDLFGLPSSLAREQARQARNATA